MANTRPTPLAVRVDEIPNALKADRRWVAWRYELRDGRWAKILCATSGHHAKANDPATWTTFADVIAVHQNFDGVGFCFGDGWSGVDLDHCRDKGNDIEAALGSLQRLRQSGAYVEVSPSATGYKAIGHAARIGGQIDFNADRPAFTTWQGARFFTITGHGSGDPTADISEIIDNWFPVGTSVVPLARPSFIRDGDVRGTENIERLSDDDVVRRILDSPQADKFVRLVRGDLSDYGNDHSRADQAFVCILAYWCQGDSDQIDRLFRQSGLMRAKWNTASYRRATLAKAGRLWA
jgi:primase-polymerase (primpol)-like protein